MQRMSPELLAYHVAKNRGGLIGDGTIYRTPPFRMSWPSLFKATKAKDDVSDTPPKFSVACLFPAGVDLSPLNKLIEAAALEKFGSKTPLESLKMPIKDQASKTNYQGYVRGLPVFTASSKHRPTVLEAFEGSYRVLQDEEEIYAGCWGIATCNVYPYGHSKAKGVGVGLQSVLKIADDEKFSNFVVDPERDFGGTHFGEAAADAADARALAASQF